MKIGLLVLLALVLAVAGVAGMAFSWAVGINNDLVAKNELVNESWGQVQNTYQRRNDLIPNLAETVQGYAKHEKDTFTGVATARASVGQVKIDPSNLTPEMLSQFQKAQGELSGFLSRLMVISERYPELKASEGFLRLQSQLEGSENAVANARMNFNKSAQDYNTALKVFPASLIAAFRNFQPKPYFEAEAGANKAPKVDFGTKEKK